MNGATLAAFTLPEAQRINSLEGKLQSIDISVDDKSQVDQQSIQAVLPSGNEVAGLHRRDRQPERLSPIIDTFGNVLLASPA